MSKPALLSTCSAYGAPVIDEQGEIAKFVQLLPMGSNHPRNGNPPLIVIENMAHAEQIVAASVDYHKGAEIVIDYDHQTVRAPAVAGKAEASGWMKRLYADPVLGICADVEWTEEAAEALRKKKYRYISPYFRHTADGRVTGIINAGLTNTPNLDLLAVASSMDGLLAAASAISTEEDDDQMSLKAIASALGLADDADEAAIIAAATAATAKATQFDATASALGVELKEGVELTSVASAATELKKGGDPDPTKFVPMSVVTEIQTEMSAIKGQLNAADDAERKKLLDDAQNSGRLAPAMRKHFEANIKDKTALASALADLAPALEKTDLGKDPKVEKGQLTDDERAIASSIGLSPEDYLKTRDEKDAL